MLAVPLLTCQLSGGQCMFVWKFDTTAQCRKPKPADPAVDPDTLANVTDPDSGIMKTRHSWLQGYNAQIVVTVGQIILAADVTTEANDVHQLTPMLNQAQENVAEVVSKDAVLGAAVADAGYWSASASSHTLSFLHQVPSRSVWKFGLASPPLMRISS